MPHRGKYLFLLPYEQWVTFGPNQLPKPAHPQRGDRDGAGVGHPLMPEAAVGCICPSQPGLCKPCLLLGTKHTCIGNDTNKMCFGNRCATGYVSK